MNVRAPSLIVLTIVTLMAAALQSPVAFTQSTRQFANQSDKPGDSKQAQTSDVLRDLAYRSPSDRHKVVISDRRFARSLQSQGGQLIGDYGSFQVLDVDTRTADTLRSTSAVEEHDDFNLIMLNAGPIDTTTPQAAALRHPVGAFVGKRMHLVQFAGPIQPAWYDALMKTGVTVVTYIPSNAYLVYGDAASLTQVQQVAASSAFVQWDGAYLDAYRIDPALRGAPDGQIAVQLVADAAANRDTLALIDSLKQAQASQQSVLNYLNLVVTVPGAAIATIAAQPDVVSIQPYTTPVKLDERQDQIIAGNLSGNSPSGPGYLTWLAGKGFTQAQFTASGFAVDVTDSGLDNATTSPNHFGLYVNGVKSGASRVIYNRLEGSPNAGSTLAGQDGHGTLNAHIIAAYNDLVSGFPHTDGSGFHYGLGVAPFVKVGSSVIFDPDSYTFPNFNNLQSKAYQDGARISSNSWGANVAGAYNTDSQAYDALVRDAQPSGSAFPTAGNQEMVIVFAAGNRGAGAGTVGSPGTGKNVITVGASENVNPFGGSDGSGIGDTGADSANDIIFFSSRGPALDGRKKPDIMAPGTHITGGVWQTAVPGLNGTADPAFNGSGVSGGVASNFFPPGQQWYTSSSGTSHSTPAIAGAAALLRQYFINQGLPPPSPALTKAYLMNAASYMNGVGANDTLYSNNQGMGRVNLGTAFDGVPRIMRDQIGADTFTASGQTRMFTGVVDNSAYPFRVTLAWTDAPGATSGNAFNNDLDLAVTVNGNTYLGNVFTGANSTTGGAADTRNNVESVFLPAGIPAGTAFSVSVNAANINSDGVPNSGGALDQDFALVIGNAVPALAPVVVGAGSNITAENVAPPNGRLDPGETLTVDFSLRDTGGANTTNLVATLQSTGGVTAPSGPQTYGVLSAGGAAVPKSFTFTADPSIVAGGSVVASLQLQDGASDLGTVAFVFNIGTANLFQAGQSLTAESYAPPNGLPDPGETITVDLSLRNLGAVKTTNLVATLQPTGGVTIPSGPQAYGALTSGGPAAAKSFTFTIDPTVRFGGVVTATLALQDGTSNLGSLAFLFNLSTLTISGAGQAITAENATPANGVLDPGETVTVDLGLQQAGTATTSNVVATLQPSGGVTAPSGPQSYGSLQSGGPPVSRSFTFTVDPTIACGQTMTATLALHDSVTNLDLGTVSYVFTLGTSIPGTGAAGANAAPIAIPATGTSGPAAPYPSTITVTGATGKIIKATVTITNVTHTFPGDIDILLVSPSGQSVILLSDIGGTNDINNVTLTFDDAAAGSVPGTIVSGTYKPTNSGGGDTFASPAPAGPYGATLAALNGGNPNGTWSLYVVDDAGADVGSIGGGWGLTITTALPVCAAAPADVAIAKSVSPSVATPGQTITYTLVYTNSGPATAMGMIVTDTLPITLTNASYTSSGPVTLLPGPKYSWRVADLPGGGSGAITVTGVISPELDAPTTLLNTATITGAGLDTNPANNTSGLVPVNVVIPQVAFGSATYSVNEGAGTATITVTVTPTPGVPIQVNYATGGGTATAGSDYQTASGTLTIPAGASQASFIITINDDIAIEPNETVGLTLSGPSGATLGSPATATLTIHDDDGPHIYLPLVRR